MKAPAKTLWITAALALAITLGSLLLKLQTPRDPAGAQTSVKANIAIPASDADAVAAAIREAALPIQELTVKVVDGIVILRGQALSPDAAARAVEIARARGHIRVANLIQMVAPADDGAIRRDAERRLAESRALEGCRFRLASREGVLTVRGDVKTEIQEDVARSILRRVDGVQELRAEFRRF